jgi:16S rRNA (guanine527-N7)-methyltransferase
VSSLKESAAEFGLDLSDAQLAQFELYRQILLDWNKRINLISRKDTGRIASYHFLDSLTASSLIPTGSSVADIGAGAGLPGIPLKIARPDILLTLVESVGKKARFLTEAVKKLGLDKTSVLAIRAEDIKVAPQDGNVGNSLPRSLAPSLPCLDVIVCRLLGTVDDVLPMVVRLLKPGGRVIFYKSATAEAELARARRVMERLHFQLLEIRDVRFDKTLRRLVVLQLC